MIFKVLKTLKFFQVRKLTLMSETTYFSRIKLSQSQTQYVTVMVNFIC